MFVKKIFNEEYYNEFLNFDEEWNNDTDYIDREISDEEYEFADDIFNYLQAIIDENDVPYNDLNEVWINKSIAKEHYNKHCLKNLNKKSRTSKVYYDFNNFQDYLSREKFVDSYVSKIRTNKNEMYIPDIYDVPKITNALKKLLNGNQTVVFSTSCGFANNIGRVSISIHSFATNVTTNYGRDTFDVIVQTPDDKTISLYPIDVTYLKTKLNNLISRFDSKHKI